MTNRVIGVVGKIGSGKDEVLKYLKQRYGVPYISTGDIVRDIAAREGIEATRENLESISERCFATMGKGCFVKMAGDEIKKRGWQIAGISGIRAPADVKTLKEMFVDSFILVRVEVQDPELRFQRVVRRHEGRDPEKYEQFQVQDYSEEEIFHISKTAGMADYAVGNDGTLDDLHTQVDELVASKKLLGT
jgi:dephospho-CoA kinase